ncbi:hypothetical protein Q4595_17490, partial [Wenyingzhuangia sp. 1_MG-2023]|nr:hypothetical protein [Wenyingzhuangia sp. 1_MG-2023]
MLKAKLKQKLARAKQIRTDAEAASRELTEAEATELTNLANDCKTIKAQIDQQDEFEALEASINAGTGRRTGHNPVASLSATVKEPELEAMGGFQDEGEFFSAVYRASTGTIDQRLTATATNVVGADGGDEGFSLPPAMRNQIFTLLDEDHGDLVSQVAGETTSARSVSYLK